MTLPVHVAPMMKVTTAPFRHLCRLLNPEAVLYTEMIGARALVEADSAGRARLLRRTPDDDPVVVQLGGSDPDLLCRAAQHCQETGRFPEINLNLGCPSVAVQSGRFGAAMMLDDNVADTVKTVASCVDVPISVKCRIGVDQFDSYDFIHSFVDRVHSRARVQRFVVHARTALLNRTPKDNRSIPPLRYDVVHRLKRDFPDLQIVINGGLHLTDDHVIAHANANMDGVMIGRSVRDDPYQLRRWRRTSNEHASDDVEGRARVVLDYVEFVDMELKSSATRRGGIVPLIMPLLNLFSGTVGSGTWKRALSATGSAVPVPDRIRRALDELERARQGHRERERSMPFLEQ